METQALIPSTIDNVSNDDISLKILMQQHDILTSVVDQTRDLLRAGSDIKVADFPTSKKLPPLADHHDEDLDEEAENEVNSGIVLTSCSRNQSIETTFRCSCCTNDGLNIDQDLGWSHDDCETLWCADCLKSILKSGLGGDSAFPPYCCDLQLDFKDILPFLSPELRERYEERSAMANMTRPLYCAKSTCSQLLGDATKVEANSAKFVVCGVCETNTCLSCRQPGLEHDAADTCPTESLSNLTQELLLMDFGENEDGNVEVHHQCICGNILSRLSGCLHVICLVCLREICMGCGRVWFYECTCNNVAITESKEGQEELIEWQESVDNDTDRPDVKW